MNIPTDKKLHFFGGFIISALFSLFFVQYIDWVILSILSFGLATVVGVLKEWWDSKGNGTVDLWDAIATSLGGLFASLLFSFDKISSLIII